MDSSIGSTTQNDESTTDKVSSSICMTLNRLIQLSKEQESFLKTDLNSRIEIAKSINDLSILYDTEEVQNQMSVVAECIENNNLVEEVHVKNHYLDEISEQVNNVSTATSSNGVTINEFGNTNKKFLSTSTNCISTSSNFETSRSTDGASIISTNSKKTFIQHNTGVKSRMLEAYSPNLDIVIAVDIGTSYSGFAYSYADNSDENIHIMKKLLDNDMKKVPSILLLNLRTEFHSFGYEAKDNYLSIEQNVPSATSQWLFFDKFKFQLHNSIEIDQECTIKAANGINIPLITVFSRALNYFKWRALQDISKRLERPVKRDNVRWIITIPAIWASSGKLFMQEAAYNAGLCAADTYSKLSIIYEPDAALEWCMKLYPVPVSVRRNRPLNSIASNYTIVVNCGGGSVDISIHEMKNDDSCVLINIHKTCENIYSSIGVNDEFVRLLNLIFGQQFIMLLKMERPALFLDLILQFESSSCFLSSNNYSSAVEIILNETFIELYGKIMRKQVKDAIVEFGHEDITCNENGTIKMNYPIITQLFQPILYRLNKQLNIILRNYIDENSASCMYIVGGFSRSEILQKGIWENFAHRMNVIFPENDFELYVLKGAICKGLHPLVNKIYRVPHSYAIGVLKPFEDHIHPQDKLVIKSGGRWCCDLLDIMIRKDQALQLGEIIIRRYTPANNQQSHIVINIYSVEYENSRFITDIGVHKCGILHLATLPSICEQPREMLLQLVFDGKDFTASILDMYSGRSTYTQLDSISYL